MIVIVFHEKADGVANADGVHVERRGMMKMYGVVDHWWCDDHDGNLERSTKHGGEV